MLAFYSSQEASQQKLYIELLKACTSFSNLFSCSSSPYLYYRTHENIFALSFKAINLSRDDISIDAKKAHIGDSIKLTKIGAQKYKCQFSKSGSFEAFEKLYKK